MGWNRGSGTTTRVSVATDGAQADGESIGPPSISADGRYIAFESDASNLVAGGTNDDVDVFVHHRDSGATTRVSVASDGAQADGDSWEPSISGDGRYIAFWSEASNLVAGDGPWDVFVHDRDTGATTQVSVASDGAEADGDSRRSSISGDGRYVAFDSGASNLVAGDTNNRWDVFVHDRDTGAATRVSVASDGAQADGGGWQPSISGEGRYVAFESGASNAGDTNGVSDVFVHDYLGNS